MDLGSGLGPRTGREEHGHYLAPMPDLERWKLNRNVFKITAKLYEDQLWRILSGIERRPHGLKDQLVWH